ncbi:IS4/IS5 family transposase [Falsigemmobacter faecalis]|uniref:IS4/IS5 family transposase n=1 Tax=Falsigemmobacter faecalis TaxID=2488730 RepID=A0A3P3DDL5_9RHOB|nr:IS4/IS5 family transposase [Falsigemmobacter faecalis]
MGPSPMVKGGEGERQWRKHGGSKRSSSWFLEPMAKSWPDGRKVHVTVDEKTPEVRAVDVTSGAIGDAPVLPDLLSQIALQEKIACVTADGAYDTGGCHCQRCGSDYTAPKKCLFMDTHHRRCQGVP